jgi:hypothetical protein
MSDHPRYLLPVLNRMDLVRGPRSGDLGHLW